MANYQFKPANRMRTNKMHPVNVDRVIMNKRPLGATGLYVGEVGLGTGPLGRLGMGAIPDDEAKYFIGTALDQEACLIDTAPSYGAGRAERLVGEVIKDRRSQAVVMTKAGYADGAQDFSPAALRKDLEASLKRLNTDYVDVLLLHNPPDKLLAGPDPAWVEMAKFKAEGKVKAIGAAVNGSAQIKAACEKSPAQVLLTPFNIFNQEAASAFSVAAAKRVGLVACSPMDSGFLTGRYGPFHLFADERARFSPPSVARRAELSRGIEFALRPTVRESETAIQFVLAHPEIASCVPGASDWHHVTGNVSACSEGIPPETVKALKAFWEKELKGNPLAL